jgi:RimJ/RimL family protein N-acetyltransferase
MTLRFANRNANHVKGARCPTTRPLSSASARPVGAVLRDVSEADLDAFYEHQLDPEATRMALFPARDRESFDAHWQRLLADDALTKKTVVYDGNVAGNVLCWEMDGRRLVGYWLGREFWGRGIATRALAEFLEQLIERPLHALVAPHNVGSIRVLEKCGFVRIAEDDEELTLELSLRPAPPATARTDRRRR